MKKTITILLSGHGQANMETLQTLISQLPGVKTQLRIMNGYDDHDFLGGELPKADLLIHFLGAKAETELEALSKQGRHDRPITLIVYDRDMADTRTMRLAIQTGARDFIMGTQIVEETLVAVRKILKEDIYGQTISGRSLTALVNAKGGAGASTIACALAYALTTKEGLQTLLLDLDLQFGTQSLRLNLGFQIGQGLAGALESIDSLDEIALLGYVAKHADGLHVLGRSEREIILPGEISEQRLKRMIELSHRYYEHLVADLPRLIDPIFNIILEQADHILVVMQQELSSVRDAKRMVQIITQDLGVPFDKIILILNRYQRHNTFGIHEVKHALGVESIIIVPNDFKNLTTASNLGVPIAEHAPKSPVILPINKLAETLGGKTHTPKPGKLRQFMLSLLSGH